MRFRAPLRPFRAHVGHDGGVSTAAILPDIRYALIGGHVVVDLMNTVEWRLDPDQTAEELTSFGHLVAWAQQSELLTPEEVGTLATLTAEHPRLAERALADVMELRENAYGALLHADDTAAAAVMARYVQALTRARLCRDESDWAWQDHSITLDTIGDRLAIAAVDLMRSREVKWLHQCEDVICGWVYLDTSRRRNRRWCIADECGNRNRARAYYARKTGRA